MTRTQIACVCFASLLGEWSTTTVDAAPLFWSVDTATSFLTLSLPTQPVSFGGTSSGNALFRNQGATSGSWTVGNKSPISGTVATDFADGSLIKFRAGESSLSALNTGNFTPNPAAWNAGTQTFSPANSTAAAAFGGQIGATQFGGLPIVVDDAFRFALRSIAYDLSSANLVVAGNQFAANQTTFGMSSGSAGVRGNSTFSLPSELGTLAAAGISVSGANSAALGTITAPDPMQPNLRKLTLPISIPMSLQLFDGAVSTLTGTATGQIVAFTLVPEPTSLLLGSVGAMGAVWFAGRRRSAARSDD